MKNKRAIGYSQTEADYILKFPSPFLYKKRFTPDGYILSDFEKFSKILDQNLRSMVAEINGVKVFALWFSDGSIYEFGRGWRTYKYDPAELKKLI